MNHYKNSELNSDYKMLITVMLQQPQKNTAGFSDDRLILKFLAEDNLICGNKLCKFDVDITVIGYIWNLTRLLLLFFWQ